MRRFFFCRHGKIWDKDTLSNDGVRGLELTKSRLLERGFKATDAWSSTQKQCVLTANLLAPGVEVRATEALHSFGNVRTLLAHADEFLAPLFAADVPKFANILAVSHDCMPAVMAWRMVKRNGGIPKWKLGELNLLEMGAGLLVEETECLYIPPQK